MVALIVFILCGLLWRAGGEWKGWMRDTLVPISIGLYFLQYHWWLFPMLAGTYQIIRLGYGVNSPLKKVFKYEPLVRGVYGLICGAVGALPIAFFNLFYYILYCIVVSFTMFVLVYMDDKSDKINVWYVEIISGLSVGSIVFIGLFCKRL